MNRVKSPVEVIEKTLKETLAYEDEHVDLVAMDVFRALQSAGYIKFNWRKWRAENERREGDEEGRDY